MEIDKLSKVDDSARDSKELAVVKKQIKETVDDLYWSIRGFEQDLSPEKKKEYSDVQKKFFAFKDAFESFKP
jgi:hypothetical protein